MKHTRQKFCKLLLLSVLSLLSFASCNKKEIETIVASEVDDYNKTKANPDNIMHFMVVAW